MADAKSAPLDRWLAVLELYTERDAWGVREAAAAAGMSTTAAHRLLHDLQRVGFLTQDDERGPFRIGPELTRLATLIAERVDLRTIARPVLIETSHSIKETVILTLYSADRHAFWAIDAAEPPHPIRYIWESLRSWSDLHRGASGKGILAFIDEQEREAVISSIAEPARSRLRLDLDKTRARGFAISHGERFEGAVGICAPIRDACGRVVGGLVGGWPDNRTSDAKEQLAAAAIVGAASRISTSLGYRVG